MKILDFLDNVINYPVLYNISKVEDVKLLIDGFLSGCNSEEQQLLIEKFNKYVQEFYEAKHNESWDRLIRFYTYYDPATLSRFIEIYKRFRYSIADAGL